VSGPSDQAMQYLPCCIEDGRFDGIVPLQMMHNDCHPGAPHGAGYIVGSHPLPATSRSGSVRDYDMCEDAVCLNNMFV
jgi:hypothetical protein